MPNVHDIAAQLTATLVSAGLTGATGIGSTGATGSGSTGATGLTGWFLYTLSSCSVSANPQGHK